MAAISSVTIRPARRDDVGIIVGMLADDALGSGRERIEDPLPVEYSARADAGRWQRRDRLSAALHPARMSG